MIFFYKAKTKNGDTIEGFLEGEDRFKVAHAILMDGNIPLSVVDKNKKGGAMSMSLGSFGKIFSKVKVQEKIIFTRNLSGMLKAGLSLSRALSVLEKQTKNPAFNDVLLSLHKEIDRGESFSSALSKFQKVFSNLFVSMIKAGEESGNLSGALSEIGMNLEKSNSISKKVKGALMYPAVILSVMVVVGILMFAFVVPTLAKTFTETGAELPGSTKLILGIGNLFSEHLFLTFLTLILLGVGGYFFFKAKFMQPIFDRIIVRLPLIGTLVKELNTARTARTLSSLISSGVSLTRAVEITQDVVQNIYYRQVLATAKEAVEKGSAFSESFKKHTDLYPIMVGEMMEVGEETGKLSDMLLEIANFYEEEVENKTKNLSTIIEPVLMVVIGAGVGFFAVSIITPLYSIMDTVK